MNLNEFQELSKRTMPYNGEPANQAEFENMLGNYAMGLVGEATELLDEIRNGETEENHHENVLKELGDVMHYAVGLAEMLNIQLRLNPIRIVIFAPVENYACGLVARAGVVVEVAKKVIYHRHELDKKKIRTNLMIAISDVQFVANRFGYEMAEVLQINIEKLKTRYPESFNTADSINRVDVASNK